MESEMNKRGFANRELYIALIPIGIGINLGIGVIIHLLKLPLYLDAVGTILITLLIGLKAGIITGVTSFLVGGVLVNPVMPYFCGTQAAIAIYAHLVGKRGAFKSIPRTILSGIGLGVVAAVVSAPVIAILFGGITGAGASFIVAYLLSTGKSILNSVILGGVSVEPIDKTLQCLLALFLMKSIPKSILNRFQGGSLKENNFV